MKNSFHKPFIQLKKLINIFGLCRFTTFWTLPAYLSKSQKTIYWNISKRKSQILRKQVRIIQLLIHCNQVIRHVHIFKNNLSIIFDSFCRFCCFLLGYFKSEMKNYKQSNIMSITCI